MSHVVKMIGIISPNRFSNISSYIKKVVIKHISYVSRILMVMDDIIMNYFLYSIFGNSYRDWRSLFQKFLNLFFNNIIVLIL